MKREDYPLIVVAIAILAIAVYAILSINFSCPSQDGHNAPAICVHRNMEWWNSAAAWTAIFTFALTVSTIGLWLVTRSSVRETRRIGEAQVRAYISIKSVKFVFMGKEDPLPMVEVTVINTGQSPAKSFEWFPTIEYQTEVGAIIEPFSEEMFHGVGVDIGASKKYRAKHIGVLPLVETISRHMSMPDRVFIRVQVHYKWRDVFGVRFFEEKTFVGMAEKQPSDENMREIHPLNDSQWACILEPVAGVGEGIILIKARGEQRHY